MSTCDPNRGCPPSVPNVHCAYPKCAHGEAKNPTPVSATAPGIINESGQINGTFISEEVARELAAFRRLLETPDFAAVRKDRAGNFHVRMHRDGESLAWVAPTLDEAATLALQWTGFYEDEPK